MNGINSKIKIIMSLVAALLAAGIVAYVLYGKRVDEWRQVAHKELRETLHESAEKVDFEHSHYLKTDSIENDSLVNVIVQTEKEENVYQHVILKGGQNVEEASPLRTIHSVLHMEGLLSVDSLERLWNVRLSECFFPGKGYLQMAVSGTGATDSVMSSRDGTPTALARADSKCSSKTDYTEWERHGIENPHFYEVMYLSKIDKYVRLHTIEYEYDSKKSMEEMICGKDLCMTIFNGDFSILGEVKLAKHRYSYFTGWCAMNDGVILYVDNPLADGDIIENLVFDKFTITD